MQDSYRQGLSDAREASKARIRKLEQRLAALDWTPITPENLPQKGHEAGYRSKSGQFVVLSIYHSRLTYKQWKHEGWSHFRAINAPAPESQPAGESPDPNPSKS
jgi:hypothetical protein